jgi:hypothetical protein
VYVPVPPPTDGLAVASFVLSLLGFNLIAVILGHVALRRIRTTGAGGHGFAIAGLVIGYTTLTVIALALLAVGGLSLWAVFAGNGGA